MLKKYIQRSLSHISDTNLASSQSGWVKILFTLMMEAVSNIETSINIYETTLGSISNRMVCISTGIPTRCPEKLSNTTQACQLQTDCVNSSNHFLGRKTVHVSVSYYLEVVIRFRSPRLLKYVVLCTLLNNEKEKNIYINSKVISF